MSELLSDLEVLALDCQAAGATPAYGDLLELGWAVCSLRGLRGSVHGSWIVPRTGRPIRRAVRELTGWTEACLGDALDERQAWTALCATSAPLARSLESGAPTVIHFARFELAFLRDLHERLERDARFPFDAVCLHAVAQRLFPDLPRRNIRALAGYLGHSPGLVRRSAGHVEATAFIWSACVPLLEQAGVRTWSELKSWLGRARPAPRSARRVYPLASERRRALPDVSGVYRFLRRNGDVLYVGKATSLKKRVASHFKGRGPTTERALELLTQVHDIAYTETHSLIEAALLESDEIKRWDPPYNVQLRAGARHAWFASRDLLSTSIEPGPAHVIGPLPSERSLVSFAALIALAGGARPTPGLRARSLAVPLELVPDESLFDEGFGVFSGEHLTATVANADRIVHAASLTLWLTRGRKELDAPSDERDPEQWDLARVKRRLERSLLQGGLLIRRTRWLCLLAGADVAFRENDMSVARLLRLARAEIVDTRELPDVASLVKVAARRPGSLSERQRAFDAAAYDRLRVLLTELCRIRDEGGDIALRAGRHVWRADALARAIREV